MYIKILDLQSTYNSNHLKEITFKLYLDFIYNFSILFIESVFIILRLIVGEIYQTLIYCFLKFLDSN